MNTDRFSMSVMSARPTPYYMYDMGVLHDTLAAINASAAINPKFRVHYAMKACYDPTVLAEIRRAGLGIDTVSGGEISIAIERGFDPGSIMFAGVGKTDREIDLALNAGIGCFNVESIPELEVISQRAEALGKIARVALRINPEIDAHTHHYITTGIPENKFGINLDSLNSAVKTALSLPGIDLQGFHFHIGSQITVNEPFAILAKRINSILDNIAKDGIHIKSINVGGGLAVDYDDPIGNAIPDFASYFNTFNNHLNTDAVDEVHFELGRAVVAQCGWLVARVVYVKEAGQHTFVILDAGMTELIRPALYQARHAIYNLTGEIESRPQCTVDIVGPVCESADEFGSDYLIAAPRRGDIFVIGSAGAYGQVMASNYNARRLEHTLIIN